MGARGSHLEDRGRERLGDGRTASGAQYLQRAARYMLASVSATEDQKALPPICAACLPARRRPLHQAPAPGARGNFARAKASGIALRSCQKAATPAVVFFDVACLTKGS
jgi:hypothetical protein